jgi:hypothetical protein
MIVSRGAVFGHFGRNADIDLFTFPFNQYAGLQAWAQAVEQAKSARGADVVPILRKQRFDTVLGGIGFDEKGDMVGPVDWVWYGWRDGKIWELLTQELHSGRVVERPGQNQRSQIPTPRCSRRSSS